MKGRDWWMLAGLGAAAWARAPRPTFPERLRLPGSDGARHRRPRLGIGPGATAGGAQGARGGLRPRSGGIRRADEDLGARGPVAAAFPCDLRDRDQVRKLFRQVRERLGPIDVLINNAGVIEVGPAETMTLEDYQDAMATNFWAPLYAILEALPEMRQRRQGRIVNIASVGGKVSVPHLLPYCASKFALVGLSEGLRAELAKDGVVVTTVCPGLMRTGSPRNATFKGATAKNTPYLRSPIPYRGRRSARSRPRGRSWRPAGAATLRSSCRCRRRRRRCCTIFSPA